MTQTTGSENTSETRQPADGSAAVGAGVWARAGVRRAAAVEMAGYLGAALLGGTFLLLAAKPWADLSHTNQLGLLVVAIVALAAAGAVVGGGTPDLLRGLGREVASPRRRLVSTLFTLASAAAAGAAAVAAQIVTDDTAGNKARLASALAGVLLGAAGYALVPALVGQLGCLLWADAALVGILHEFAVDATAASGLATLALGAVWLALASTGAFAERTASLVIGTVTALVGLQLIAVDQAGAWGYAVGAVGVIGCLAAFLVRRGGRGSLSWSRS